MTAQQHEPDAQSAITMGTVTMNNHQQADAESAGSVMTRRRLMALYASTRALTRPRAIMSVYQEEEGISSTCELDSHANTSVAGPNCKIIG